MGSCEHGNEHLGSIKCGRVADKLENCHFLKEDSTSWVQFPVPL
jgi:hypothetical protein